MRETQIRSSGAQRLHSYVVISQSSIARGVRARRLAVGTIVMSLMIACGRSDIPPARDSTPPTTGGSTTVTHGSANWVPALGAALLVPSDSDSTAILLYPDDVA